MYLIRSFVAICVVFSNVRWHWTPNPVAAWFFAVLAAYLTGVILTLLLFGLRRAGLGR